MIGSGESGGDAISITAFSTVATKNRPTTIRKPMKSSPPVPVYSKASPCRLTRDQM